MSLRLSTAPHIRSPRSTQRLMLNVIIALLPSCAAGIYFYGIKALIVMLVSTFSAVAAEFVWQKLAHKPVRIGDFSAAVTGLLLALIVTPNTPWWVIMIGSFFAIIIVKQLFGGIGDNFLNPAMAARAVLLASWPAHLTNHALLTDAVSSATPLAAAKGTYSYLDLFLGNVPGAIGETCKAAILLGLIFLIVTKTVTWRIPVFTLASTFIFAWILGLEPVFAILSGGIMFAAAFMANDYTTSPMSFRAQAVYGAGIGLLTVIIRKFGAYPEGVTYAVLFMNILTPLLDRYIPHKVYGHTEKKEVKKA